MLDRLEVGQHAAQPAVVDVRAAGAERFFLDDLARLALGADEQDTALVGSQLAHEFHRVLVHDQGFFQVDDMNLVAMAENVRGHLGVPETGLVSEMDARFQHLTHGHGHFESPVRVSFLAMRRSNRRNFEKPRHPDT